MTENANLPVEHKPQIVTGGVVAGLVPQSLDEAYRVAQWCAKSGLTPKGIDTPEKCLYVIMAGADLGMPPAQSLQSFALINGRLSLWGDAIPALLWSKGFKIKEWTDDAGPDYPDAMTARCKITRPDGDEIEGEFSVADAKEAKLWAKEGPWQTSRKRMLKMRARSFCARDGAPDVLRGLYIAEEAQDFVQIAGETHGERTGMVERLKARAQPAEVDAAGFNVRQITAETDAAKPRRGKGKATDTPAPDEVTDAEIEEQPQGDAAANAVAALDGDDLPGDLARPTGTGSAQAAEHTLDSSGSATDASGDSAGETSSPAQPSEPSADGEKGMTTEFIDPDTGEVYRTIEARMEAERAKKIETEPQTGFEACTAFINQVADLKFWAEIKQALSALKKTEDWTSAPPRVQQGVHAAAWRAPARVRDKVDPGQDPTGFFCWLGTMPEEDQIDGTLAVLQNSDAWTRLTPPQRTRLEDAARKTRRGELLKAEASEAPEMASAARRGAESSPSGQATEAPDGDDDVSEGVAAPGDVYFLAGERWDEGTKRRPTYRNGKPYSSATRPAYESGKVAIYARHPGETADRARAPETPQEGRGAKSATTLAEESREGPGDAPDAAQGDDHAEEFDAFAQAVAKTTGWPALKALTSAFRRTPACSGAPLDLQNQAMLLAYNHALDNGMVAPEGDVEWFRLWLATIDDDTRDQVRPMARKVFRGEEYRSQITDAERDAVVDETNRASGE